MIYVSGCPETRNSIRYYFSKGTAIWVSGYGHFNFGTSSLVFKEITSINSVYTKVKQVVLGTSGEGIINLSMAAAE